MSKHHKHGIWSDRSRFPPRKSQKSWFPPKNRENRDFPPENRENRDFSCKKIQSYSPKHTKLITKIRMPRIFLLSLTWSRLKCEISPIFLGKNPSFWNHHLPHLFFPFWRFFVVVGKKQFFSGEKIKRQLRRTYLPPRWKLTFTRHFGITGDQFHLLADPYVWAGRSLYRFCLGLPI